MLQNTIYKLRSKLNAFLNVNLVILFLLDLNILLNLKKNMHFFILRNKTKNILNKA